jgi:hypothetical protein
MIFGASSELEGASSQNEYRALGLAWLGSILRDKFSYTSSREPRHNRASTGIAIRWGKIHHLRLPGHSTRNEATLLIVGNTDISELLPDAGCCSLHSSRFLVANFHL